MPSVPAFPDPYFFSSAGVPSEGVRSEEEDLLTESSFWGAAEDLDSEAED
jgi:hypothetical protein